MDGFDIATDGTTAAAAGQRSAAVKVAAVASLQLLKRGGAAHHDEVIGLWRLFSALAENDEDPHVADAAFVAIGALLSMRPGRDLSAGRVGARRLPPVLPRGLAHAQLRQLVCDYLVPHMYHLFVRAATLASGHSDHGCGANAMRTVSRLLAYLIRRRVDTVRVDKPPVVNEAGVSCRRATLPAKPSIPTIVSAAVSFVDVALSSLVVQWVSTGLLPAITSFLRIVQRTRATTPPTATDRPKGSDGGIGAAGVDYGCGVPNALVAPKEPCLGAIAAACAFSLMGPLRAHRLGATIMSRTTSALVDWARMCYGRCVYGAPGRASGDASCERGSIWCAGEASFNSHSDAYVRSFLRPIVDAAPALTQMSFLPSSATSATAALLPVYAAVAGTLGSSQSRVRFFQELTRAFVSAATRPRRGDAALTRGSAGGITKNNAHAICDALGTIDVFWGAGALATALIRGAENQATADSIWLAARQRCNTRDSCYGAFDPIEESWQWHVFFFSSFPLHVYVILHSCGMP